MLFKIRVEARMIYRLLNFDIKPIKFNNCLKIGKNMI